MEMDAGAKAGGQKSKGRNCEKSGEWRENLQH